MNNYKPTFVPPCIIVEPATMLGRLDQLVIIIEVKYNESYSFPLFWINFTKIT